MVAVLSEQQRQVVEAESGCPVPVVDENNNRVYYLISAELFEKLRPLIAKDDFQPGELYPLIAQTAADAGWSDPLMDAYDNYDEAYAQRSSR